MKASEGLGERKIIEILKNCLEILPEMSVPFGDDVSAYDLGNEKMAVLKTDMLVDKTDVPPGMNLWQAARKAVVMNISDFAAKGVEPLAILVSLGLPRNLKENQIQEIGEGLNAGAREYDAYIVGGDTNEASDVVISLSVFGITEKNRLMLRSGARNGDIVGVTGLFGKTSAGLKILLENLKEVPHENHGTLINSVLIPHARLEEGLILSRTGAVTSCIDSSDGLAWSLHELAKTSGVGFLIDSLPIAEEVEKFCRTNKLDPLELTLYGGEEYELVLTVKPRLWNKAKKAVEKVGGALLPIGRATFDRKVMLEYDGKKSSIESRGWEHLRT
ncbi:MAG: thiamine-phosphate kinase [Candidatus Bathyarchaeota archaeon]|jgi:thiamine-monophosphate kinase